MVTDMNLSSDMGTAFGDHLRENDIKLDTDVSVQARHARCLAVLVAPSGGSRGRGRVASHTQSA